MENDKFRQELLAKIDRFMASCVRDRKWTEYGALKACKERLEKRIAAGGPVPDSGS